jgi:phytoene dehydrogenase-like protein
MKINIIGAGISGLTAGCYLQLNGFETEIFEQQSKPGGLCTSWNCGEYTFDGCLHWLMGSGPGNPFYKLWSELIDMSSVRFINHDVRVDIEVKNEPDKYGNKVFHLYTDLETLEKYLMDLSPLDTILIKKLIRSMRQIQKFEIPPLIETNLKVSSFKQKTGMIKYLPLLWFMLKWKSVTNYSFARKFKDPFLKEAFELLFDGEEMPLLIITIPLSFFDRKATGYPVGGSLRFAKKIEDKYLALGGKIQYGAVVKQIITDRNVARGILLEDGREIVSEITVSAGDWHSTVFSLLDGKYVNKAILELGKGKKLRVYYSVVLISLGISRTFQNQSHFFRFPLDDALVSPDGTRYSRAEVQIYNFDPTLAPAGKTVVSVSFYTKNGDFWIDLRQSDNEQYKKAKADFASNIIDILDKKLGAIKEKIEVVDVTTPASFFRYTGNWKGSVQGWLPGKNFMASSPVNAELPGLKNFYFGSHWSIPGGGLPTAIKTSRDLAQLICRKYHKEFKGSPGD